MLSSEMFERYETELLNAIPKVKAIKYELVCPLHKRRVLVKFDYTNEGTHAYIFKYCCLNHANTMADALEKAQLVDFVHIEN